MASGVGGLHADCIPAPGRQASVLRETKRSSALKPWTSPRFALTSVGTAERRPTVRKDGFSGKGGGAGDCGGVTVDGRKVATW